MDFLVGLFMGALVTALVTISFSINIYQDRMTENCCGQYDSKTAEFQVINMCKVNE